MKKHILFLYFTVACILSAPSYADKLTQKEGREIAEKYIEAFIGGHFNDLKQLFSDPSKLNKNEYLEYKEFISKMKFTGISEGHLRLELPVQTYGPVLKPHLYSHLRSSNKRWLLLTPDRKIKYDSILLKHPIELGFQNASLIDWFQGLANKGAYNEFEEKRNVEYAQVSLNILRTTEIPLFNLDLNNSPREISGEVKKINKWLHDNWDSWDASEPKIFFPKIFYRAYKH